MPFRPPADATIPLIMVGPGTGVAPFRGFLQERAALAEQGKRLGPALLFFGCRHPDQDDIYRDEMEAYATHGVATIYTAYSRMEGQPKAYVQDLLQEHADEVWRLLQAGGHRLRLRRCGCDGTGSAQGPARHLCGEDGDDRRGGGGLAAAVDERAALYGRRLGTRVVWGQPRPPRSVRVHRKHHQDHEQHAGLTRQELPSMSQVVSVLQHVVTLAFVLSSMLATGLALTIPQIVKPLRNVRLVVMALVANFVHRACRCLSAHACHPDGAAAPDRRVAAGHGGGRPLPAEADVDCQRQPCLCGRAHDAAAGGDGVLPARSCCRCSCLGSTSALGRSPSRSWRRCSCPWGLASSSRHATPSSLTQFQPTMAQASSISLILLLVLMLGLNIRNVIGLIGSGGLLAVLLLSGVGAAAGYLLGGPGSDTRRVLALGTGQRNLAAALIVATGNFAAIPDVLILLAAAGLVQMVVMMPLAGEFGKHAQSAGHARPVR